MRTCLLLWVRAAGGFPYRELDRPALTGVVRGLSGAPLVDAQVVSCSETRRRRMAGCPRAAGTRTGEGAASRLEPYAEWERRCSGEAPLCRTVVVAGAPDGRLAVGAPSGSPLELVLGPPPEPEGEELAGPVSQCRAAMRRGARQQWEGGRRRHAGPAPGGHPSDPAWEPLQSCGSLLTRK